MLGQIPNSTPEGMGAWLVSMAAILGVVYLVAVLVKTGKELFFAPPPLTLQSVPPAYARQEDLLKLEQYTHESIHELRNSLHLLQLRIVEVRESISRDMAAQSEKIVRELSRLSALMEVRDKDFVVWRDARDESLKQTIAEVLERGGHTSK